jgi:acid phosphatase type 7
MVALLGMLFALALGGRAQASLDRTVATLGDMACAPYDPSYNGGAGTATACRQRYVSDLLVDPVPDALLDLGDNQYDSGELANYRAVYDHTFGRANAVVYPSIGNAEYDTGGARGFFDYFSSVDVTSRIADSGADTSNFGDGYYSFDLGVWHLIALNSNCRKVGGCGSGSDQEVWLKNDLAAHPNRCTLAYWHHPRWNSGELGNDSSSSAFWSDLYKAHADLVLNGHGNHHYERFALQNPSGDPDTAKGIREFIVSTGGQSHGTPPIAPGDPDTSQVTDYTSFGVLMLTLHTGSYDWQFVPEAGGSFSDSGSGKCHTPAQKPAAPSPSATGGDSVVHLSWPAPPDGGARITGYNLYRSTSSGDETLLDSVGAGNTYYDDHSVTNDTRYYYRLTAVNLLGEGPQSKEVSATPALPPPPPPPPPPPALPPPLDHFTSPPAGPAPASKPPAGSVLAFGPAVVGADGVARVVVRCNTRQVSRCTGTLSATLVRATQGRSVKRQLPAARYSIASMRRRTIRVPLSRSDAAMLTRLTRRQLASRRLRLRAVTAVAAATLRQTSLVAVTRKG